MNRTADEPLPRPASSPCLAGELDERGAVVVDPEQACDVARWRKAQRERLIGLRMAIPAIGRAQLTEQIGGQLEALLTGIAAPIVSVYWPIRAEPDLRPWMARVQAQGVRIALPVVVVPAAPLEFREWRPGCRMEHGVWKIPQPADRDLLTPTVSIAPLVGYDSQGFRLGYGGGYFDRTLAALVPRPLVVGVGYQALAIATIYPQPYDIPMDWIVTGAGEPTSRVQA